MSFICGFSGNQEDDLEDLCMLPKRKTTRRQSNKHSKNPYSNRGLDKFEALLADLDGKRQMLYTKKGSEDVSLVRFVYSNSNGVRPIVVKIKHHRKQEKDHHHKLENIKTPVVSVIDDRNNSSNSNSSSGDAVVLLAKPSTDYKTSITFDHLRRKLGGWWRPWYSLPFFMMLILVFLVFFTRSFVIFCTCIGWYIVPTINGTCEIPKRAKKAENSIKFSKKMVTSSLNSGPINTQPHRTSF